MRPVEDNQLPPFLATLVLGEPDDRPVPALGLGDQEAATALLAATRAVLLAGDETAVVTAVARFSIDLGGRLVPAGRDTGTALPVDIALGTGPPVLVDADALSISRMRLEQFLPTLVEDARGAISRLHALAEATAAAAADPVTGLLSHRQLMRRLPTARAGDVLCILDIDDDSLRGDVAVRELGRLISANLRAPDQAGRHSEHEIVGILRGVTERVAVERLRRLQDLWRQGAHSSVTFSVGAAAVGDGGWPEALSTAGTVMRASRPGHA